MKVKGETTVVGVAADAETGEIPGLDVLAARDADGFDERLAEYASELGVETIAADDLRACLINRKSTQWRNGAKARRKMF